MAQQAPPRPLFHDRRIMVVDSRAPLKRAGAGWVAFAATMLVVAAWVNLVWGILGLAHDAYWSGDTLLYGNASLMGWLFILIAPVQLLAALLLFADNPFGSVLGLFIAFCSAVTHIAVFGGHPAAAAIVLAIDVLTVYALLMYGFARR
jgi:hypothetical protein